MMNGMGFGWFFWVILLGVIIWGILQFTNRNQQLSENDLETPLAILKKRYAKGEISKEEFEEIKEKIK
jgi:putative membrane protein